MNTITSQKSLSQPIIPSHSHIDYPESTSYLSSVKKVQYVYTRKSPEFVGNTIYSLEQMRQMEPPYSDIYAKEIQKYVGREWHPEIEIIPLSCQWKDVISLISLHPHFIAEAFNSIGVPQREWEFFQIPIELLDEDKLAYWNFPPATSNLKELTRYALNTYSPITHENYTELFELPQATKTHILQKFNPANPIAKIQTFVGVPHVFYKGEININDSRICVINWNDLPLNL